MPLTPVQSDADDRSLLETASSADGLYPVYQPVVRLSDMAVWAHEGLIRTGAGVSPPDLFNAARRLGRLAEIELLAAKAVVGGYGFREECGRLLVNLSAAALMDPGLRPTQIINLITGCGVDGSRFIFEISERDVVEDMATLAEPLRHLRGLGASIAIDDFGSGHSNFALWQALGPEYVKLDRSIVHGVSRSSRQLVIIRALMQVADEFGCDLVAEGIEDLSDLALVRDLGIRYGQGYALALPARQPVGSVPEARDSMAAWPVPVQPSSSPVIVSREVIVANLMLSSPSVTMNATNSSVAELFRRHETLHALPVLDNEAPIGLINRRIFMERFGQPFAREIFGAKSCVEYMHEDPVVCEADTPVSSLLDILRGEDQRYLSDGFVVTRNGRFAGIGTGESLVRRVSEIRIEAARYANPLTFLPGNMPITLHLERLLSADSPFVACYADLNHFKPFNDQYGYFRGDAMIKLLAHTLRQHVDARFDFLGHVGGDDFIVLFQSQDWRERCRAIVAEFNASARGLFDAVDLERGGIEAEDRQGRASFFPITTLVIGAVVVPRLASGTAEQVASAAAQAKRRAKASDQPFFEMPL